MTPDRRHFLLGSGSALALGSLPVGASLAGGNRKQGPLLHSYAGIAVYRQDNDASRYFAAAMSQAGLYSLALAEDPVRQWRDELEQLQINNPAPLYGLTDWSDYLLLRGLAAGLRRFPQQELKLYVPSFMQVEWAASQALATLDGRAVVTDATGGQVLFNWVIS